MVTGVVTSGGTDYTRLRKGKCYSGVIGTSALKEMLGYSGFGKQQAQRVYEVNIKGKIRTYAGERPEFQGRWELAKVSSMLQVTGTIIDTDIDS